MSQAHFRAQNNLLTSFRSCNFIASNEGVWSGGTFTSYPMETCPHCLNRGGTAAQCGLVNGRNYNENLNVLGEPMAPSPQAQYTQGQKIQVDAFLTAHHMGHSEFAACPIQPGGKALGNCFEKYPLEFVPDPLYGAPKDIAYPNCAYIAPHSCLNREGNACEYDNGAPKALFQFWLNLPDND
jgi:hypothetical protein